MKLNLSRRSLFALFVLSAATAIHAQEPQLKMAAIGRLHLDGSIATPTSNGFVPGLGVTEVRAGAKATYGQWSSRVEIGYTYGKIGMKDVYMQIATDRAGQWRFGYFIPQFGIRGAGSASGKPAMLPLVSESFFRTMNRKVGVSFTLPTSNLFLSAASFVGGRSMTLNATEQGEVSVGTSVRSVYHTTIGNDMLFHTGISAFYETASHTGVLSDSGEETVTPGFRNYSAYFPVSVCRVPMLRADVKNGLGDYKFAVENVLAHSRLALESQYFYMIMPREAYLPAYQAQGANTMVRMLVAGDKSYRYAQYDGTLANPSTGSVELVAAIDYTNASLGESGIRGGEATDMSLTGNYYINPYTVVRLRYNYSRVKNSEAFPDHSINAIQARIQFVF